MPAPEGDGVWAGDNWVPILAYGEVDVVLSHPTESRILKLKEVAFCPKFVANLVSLRLLKKQGYWWDNKTPSNAIRRADDSLLCNLTDQFGQNVIEYIPVDYPKSAFITRRQRLHTRKHSYGTRATGDKWHLRLGHPGPEALAHLQGSSRGVKLRGPTGVECSNCGCSKAKQRVSREPREHPTRAGDVLALDFFEFSNDGKGYVQVLLITDRYSNYIWDIYLQDKKGATIISHLEFFFGLLNHQYGIYPRTIQMDNELADSKPKVRDWLLNKFIFLEPSAADTQAQNGGAERSGGVIKRRARAMRIGANLPEYLWTWIVKTAVYLHNRTPFYGIYWQTPYELFFTYLACRDGIQIRTRKPKQGHLRAYGSKAYVLLKGQKKPPGRNKLQPNAWIGYLVGYRGTNIYEIWDPKQQRVIATRDVTFDENEFFPISIEELRENIAEATPSKLQELLDENRAIDVSDDRTLLHPHGDDDEEEQEDLSGIIQEHLREEVDSQSSERTRGSTGTDHPKVLLTQLPTPPESPPPSMAALLAATISKLEGQMSSPWVAADLIRTPLEPYWVDAHEKRTSVLNTHVDAENSRSLRSPPKGPSKELPQIDYGGEKAWQAAFNAGRLSAKVATIAGKQVTKHQLNQIKLLARHQMQPANGVDTVTKLMTEQELQSGTIPPKRIHRKHLPKVPESHREAMKHPLNKAISQAEKNHLQSHKNMLTWIERDRFVAYGQEILDCRWVYVYKFDKRGWLIKCKARLVVRGDQQTATGIANTYAATLAGRSFRALMAIAAKVDLELIQYDAVNAFVNAKLPYPVYMRMPPGYRKAGIILELKKALYGLRESPLLWQRELTSTLNNIGFTAVPHEPCCFTFQGIYLFFYVDDIVLAYHKEQQKVVDELIRQLKAMYNLTGGDKLQWFLGIEVIRNRTQRKLWLSQSEYANKIASHYLPSPDLGIHCSTPMAAEELLPHDGVATPQQVTEYQRRTGSSLYLAVITRPDIAFAVSRLCRFNHNPGPKHRKAIDRVIRYIRDTADYALLFDGIENELVTWSDASFADNTLDRRSSQGYAMKLFGNTIAWRANKQDTVTTSTTEAELLSLSQAAKEALFTGRLVKELSIRLENKPLQLLCDNIQTIRLIVKESLTLPTKLRHVDIYNHWLRQAVDKKQLTVDYVPSKLQIADGLTKALQGGDFERFRRQIGLESIKGQLQERKLREIDYEELNLAEEQIIGGESG